MIGWPYTEQGCVKPFLIVSVSFLAIGIDQTFWDTVLTAGLMGHVLGGHFLFSEKNES